MSIAIGKTLPYLAAAVLLGLAVKSLLPEAAEPIAYLFVLATSFGVFEALRREGYFRHFELDKRSETGRAMQADEYWSWCSWMSICAATIFLA